ncbi:flavonoid 3',5'-hydroxylase-like [Triticum aestivum]|uniref:flavonoid 3',5'-hydroxylase-like n=1 Tax=Triticum aestivum TaxID=4565 RepID=UPI001D0034BB|nr:flavonoid 3',5'-hydroxylase-like [Triticum aestivum]
MPSLAFLELDGARHHHAPPLPPLDCVRCAGLKTRRVRAHLEPAPSLPAPLQHSGGALDAPHAAAHHHKNRILVFFANLTHTVPFVGPAPCTGLAALARKYGSVMYLRMGTCGVVVASSPSAARTFLKALVAWLANRPAVASAVDITYGRQNRVFADYGPKWKLMRKLSSVHLLGARAVADWAGVRRDEAGRALRGMAEAGRAVVVPEVLVCALANIVGQITVSKRVFDAQGGESSSYKEMIVSLLTGTGMFNISDFVPALSWLDLQGVQDRLRRVHRQFDGLIIITKLLAEHAATAEERAREGRLDFVDRLRASSKDGDKDADGETITEVNIKGLIFVSSHTLFALPFLINYRPHHLIEPPNACNRVRLLWWWCNIIVASEHS